MRKKNIVIIGGGGHSKVLISSLMRSESWRIIGYTDVKKGNLNVVEYLGTDDVLDSLFATVQFAVVGIGHITNYDLRCKLYNKIKTIGYTLPPIISESAVVMHNVKIGEGTFIAENAYIGPEVKIGIMNIINTGSIVEHDTECGDFVHLAINSAIGGNVTIGRGSFVGMGAGVLNGVKLGENVIIAAGTIVRKNVENSAFVYGNPMRIKKNHKQV